MPRRRVGWLSGIVAGIVVVVLVSGPFAAAAGLTLSPGQGRPGADVVVTGSGFEPGKQVKLRWDGSGLPGTVTVDETGRFSATLTVPSDAGAGSHVVSARESGQGGQASATFTVIADPTTTTVATTTTSGATTTTSGATATTSGATTAPRVTTTTSTEEDLVTPTTLLEDSAVDDAALGPTDLADPASIDPSRPAALHVEPAQVSPGQQVVATLVGAPPSLRGTRLQLDGFDMTVSTAVSEAGSAEYRFRVPVDIETGSHRVVVVVGDDVQAQQIAATAISVEPVPPAKAAPWGVIALLAAFAVGLASAIWVLAARRRRSDEDESVVPASQESEESEESPAASGQEAPKSIEALAAVEGWTRRLLVVDGSEGPSIEAMAVFDGSLYAVGADDEGESASAVVWSSTNGSDWDRIVSLGPGKATSIATIERGLIVIGAQPSHSSQSGWEWVVWTSEDGTEWRPLTEESGRRPRGTPLGVASLGEVHVVFGRSSDRAETWMTNDGGPLTPVPTPGVAELVTSTSRGFLAFGHHESGRVPMVVASQDGREWEALPVSLVVPFSGCSVYALVEFRSSMIAAGLNIVEHVAALWVSDDGRNWDSVPFPATPGTSITHLATAGDRLIAIGTDRPWSGSGTAGSISAWTTDDAVDWKPLGRGELLGDATPSAAAHLNDQLVIAGRVYQGGRLEDRGVPAVWIYDLDRDRDDGIEEPTLVGSGEIAP